MNLNFEISGEETELFFWSIKPVLATGNVGGIVAAFAFLVEDFTIVAFEFSGFEAVETDVELLTIFRVSVVGMSDDLARSIVLVWVEWAHKSVSGFRFLLGAVFSVCIFRPNASSGILVEQKVSLTLRFDVLAVDARVEDVADCLVGVSEDSVFPGTVVVGSTWGFCWLSS
jgi:hypothetical protein